MEKSTKLGFVIKLSSETVQKIAEEEEQAEATNQTGHEISQPGDSQSKEDLTGHSKSSETVKKHPTIPNLSGKQKSIDHIEKSCNTNESLSPPNTADISWGDYTPYISYEGNEAIYTDPTTQQRYSWDKVNNSWVTNTEQTENAGKVYSYENDQHIYTDSDGSKFFYDEEKKAWIPKVDDDFLAHYQMSYGFIDNTSEQKKKEEDEKKQKEKKQLEKTELAGVKRKSEPQWFEQSDDTNTKVYVSNLPLDITEEEFVDFMQKCGLVMRDPSTQNMKVKLYMDKEQNCFKGDALCTYIKIESVELALKLLDGSDFKGNKIKVERAQFELKGDYNPALKPKKKKKKELEKIKKMQQKLFDWRPEKFIGERSKHERVVILKNVFDPTDFDKEVQLILDYQQDLREECSKCGEVRKVVIFDRHPEGVCQVTMKEPEEADAVVSLINGRWFGKRQITAEIWDGRTKYRIAETDADINKRINKWDKFLEGDGNETSSKNVEPSESEVVVLKGASKAETNLQEKAESLNN